MYVAFFFSLSQTKPGCRARRASPPDWSQEAWSSFLPIVETPITLFVKQVRSIRIHLTSKGDNIVKFSLSIVLCDKINTAAILF